MTIASGAETTPVLSETIAPHLPYLRRFARAVSGTQESGDAHVAALLEAVLQDRSLIRLDHGPRVGLYAAFHTLWTSTNVDAPTEETAGGAGAVGERRLARLSPRSRQALLLSTVEGFSIDEVAAIMLCDAAEAQSLRDAAVADLKSQTKSRVLIIEDEPIIAMDLEALVMEMGHDVVAIVDTHDTAVAAANEHAPELVLADIQLADGSSGVDAVKDILEAIAVPVIFITAYPDRLLTGARPEPTFLISKPFQIETVQAAISQALFFQETVEMV